jgi:4-amino-4-deoxy-L-arabinose transferase-like glycosyltransferase
LSKLRVFALAWLVVPIVFFSLSGSKLPGYILPALPGAALLAGERLSRFVRGEGSNIVMRFTGTLALLCIGGVAYAIKLEFIPLICGVVIAMPILLCGLCALFLNRQRILAATSVVCATLLTIALIVNCGLEKAGQRESVRDLLALASARGYGSSSVFQLHTVERTAEFYAASRLLYDKQGEPVKFEGASQVLERARALGETVLVFVPVEYLDQLTQHTQLATETIGNNEAVALVAVRER